MVYMVMVYTECTKITYNMKRDWDNLKISV